jgi:hypothetical protein
MSRVPVTNSSFSNSPRVRATRESYRNYPLYWVRGGQEDGPAARKPLLNARASRTREGAGGMRA